MAEITTVAIKVIHQLSIRPKFSDNSSQLPPNHANHGHHLAGNSPSGDHVHSQFIAQLSQFTHRLILTDLPEIAVLRNQVVVAFKTLLVIKRGNALRESLKSMRAANRLVDPRQGRRIRATGELIGHLAERGQRHRIL